MNRREFLAAGVTLGTAMAAGGASLAAAAAATNDSPVESEGRPTLERKPGPFKLLYAPHFGMFQHSAGKDLVDQLKFMADEGFRALEDNGMMKRSREEQDRIASALDRLGMTMGVFVAHADFHNPTFVLRDPEMRRQLVETMKKAVELAQRINARWMTVVPGHVDLKTDWGYQTANVIDNLRACAEVCEPAGVTMVLEPLNRRDHPGLFLTEIPQAYAICRAVNSPSCKILDDLYHQQITEGNLIPNIDAAWDEIAYIQIGDNPGRKEPTTGEINYRNIFRHLHTKGFKGVCGMEHGKAVNSKEGERALIKAYRSCDDF